MLSPNTMGASLLLLFLLFLFFPLCAHSMDTLVLDGLTQWKSPIIQVGDSLVFKHKKLQNLYHFHNYKDFKLCNLSQATLVSFSTHFMWRPTRPGYYYYSSGGCENGEKVAVRVIPTPPHSSIAFPPVTAPPPTSGGELPSFPSNGWVSSSPASSLQPELGPSPAPGDSGTGIPFINSNPAVPLPTGETDTATIRPLPITGSGDDASQAVVGVGRKLQQEQGLFKLVVGLLLIMSFTFVWS
ncbi:Cupredoxins domain-containing protein [Dioscorea alata]|uniref:Cupredoxins domain-containing protein n=1 Tax=Dioscorea alata TaxID=55571 RepID=A0ACB7VZW8_DIOAL|nr:Cupredoxins domain-containing protein [Dioscorea alata]